MEVNAIAKNVRISAFKAREVTRLIQGKSYSEALGFLKLANKKAAILIKKVLESARANASANNGFNGEDSELRVKVAQVGEGPTMKRMRPRARGSADRILKRTSHIKIVLSDKESK